MTRTIRSMMVCGMVGTMSMLTACGGPSKRAYDTQVVFDDTLKGQTVEVDLIPVMNDQDLGALKGCEVNDYFKAGSQLRKDWAARGKTLTFTQGTSTTFQISRDEAMWKEKPGHIVIMANIPGMSDQKGPSDRRRLEISTLSDVWEGDKLDIMVQRSGLKITTPQKPKKN